MVVLAAPGRSRQNARKVALVPDKPAALDSMPLEPDPVIEAYKKDVDRTLIREQLRRTVDERVRRMVSALELAAALHDAGERNRQR